MKWSFAICLSPAMKWKNDSSACRKAAGFHLWTPGLLEEACEISFLRITAQGFSYKNLALTSYYLSNLIPFFSFFTLNFYLKPTLKMSWTWTDCNYHWPLLSFIILLNRCFTHTVIAPFVRSAVISVSIL